MSTAGDDPKGPKPPKDPVPDAFKDLVEPPRPPTPSTDADEVPAHLALPPELLGPPEPPPPPPHEPPRSPELPSLPAEPSPPPAPTSASISDLQAAVGVTPASPPKAVSFKPPAAAPSSTSSAPPLRLPLPPSPPRRPAVSTFSDPDADDDTTARKPRRWLLLLALVPMLGAVIGAFVLFGNANSQRYYLRCSAKYITAEQGNSFPPWGSERVSAPGFKPISIPPNAECTPQKTDSLAKLEALYLDALVEQATRKLSGTSPGDIDAAQAELEQALLLTRSPERRDQRKDLERLLGDVTYWRAAAKVKSAAKELEDAAKRFDEAALARPRHASDASEWARFARDTAAALSGGPSGAGAPAQPPSGVPLAGTREPAPPGVALPVEMPPSAGSPPDAGVEDIDAGRSTLPSGGVLM